MRSLIHELYENPLSGEAIEAMSFAAIDREAQRNHFDARQWEIVRRMVHTSADFSLLGDIEFSADAVDAGIAALRRAAGIYVDSNMIRSGVSLARLRTVNGAYAAGQVVCHVADVDVAAEAKQAKLPRSLFAVRKARPMLEGGIAAFGNAPVGLMELNRLIAEEGLRPALVIGMPVGFVHVVESKTELMKLGVPYIVIKGRRGGSPLAVSVVHALCTLAGRPPKEGV